MKEMYAVINTYLREIEFIFNNKSDADDYADNLNWEYSTDDFSVKIVYLIEKEDL